MGARKGEKDWNVGFSITDRNKLDEYEALIEYEWAWVNRLGLEVELPFFIYSPSQNGNAPASKLNSGAIFLFVFEKINTSVAIGNIHKLKMTEFTHYRKENPFDGNAYNPFYIIPKRWGQNFHTLLYTGPQFLYHFFNGTIDSNRQVNPNFHYMISGTRNFVGIEFNKNIG